MPFSLGFRESRPNLHLSFSDRPLQATEETGAFWNWAMAAVPKISKVFCQSRSPNSDTCLGGEERARASERDSEGRPESIGWIDLLQMGDLAFFSLTSLPQSSTSTIYHATSSYLSLNGESKSFWEYGGTWVDGGLLRNKGGGLPHAPFERRVAQKSPVLDSLHCWHNTMAQERPQCTCAYLQLWMTYVTDSPGAKAYIE